VPLILLGALPGNPGDASPRLRETLATAEVVTPAELARHHPGETPVAIWTGPVPDLVRTAVDLGMDITAVPGPSAAVTALALSGLPSDRFCVEGGHPDLEHPDLEHLAAEPRTLVFTELPDLAALARAFGGDRPAALVTADRTAVRATLAELIERIGPAESSGPIELSGPAELTGPAELSGPIELPGSARLTVPGGMNVPGAGGDVVLVVGGAPPVRVGRPPDEELAAEVAALVAGGADRKRATAEVAKRHSLAKREVYAAVIANK
jgi:16S rRNA (cytidine1402-2'-O)-methyltransferase